MGSQSLIVEVMLLTIFYSEISLKALKKKAYKMSPLQRTRLSKTSHKEHKKQT